MAFAVDKVFFVPHRDLLVLAGRAESAAPVPQGAIDLPREVQGPGWVPILDVQTIPFEDGTTKLCVILEYAVIESAPLMGVRLAGGAHARSAPVGPAVDYRWASTRRCRPFRPPCAPFCRPTSCPPLSTTKVGMAMIL